MAFRLQNMGVVRHISCLQIHVPLPYDSVPSKLRLDHSLCKRLKQRRQMELLRKKEKKKKIFLSFDD
jgi:hypothetical protein